MKALNRRWGPCPFCDATGWDVLTQEKSGLHDHDRPQGGRCLKAARTVRFTFTTSGCATVVGVVHGNGGKVDRLSRLEGAQRLARNGRPTGLYEPMPGCIAVYPDYSAASDGEVTIVDLLDCTIGVAS